MKTIQLKISDKVYDKFLWLLSNFSKEEVELAIAKGFQSVSLSESRLRTERLKYIPTKSSPFFFVGGRPYPVTFFLGGTLGKLRPVAKQQPKYIECKYNQEY